VLRRGYSSDWVSNCIHAVSSITEGYRLRVASPGWGEMASWYVLQEYRPWLPERGVAHRGWHRPGLERYPLYYRELESPRSGGARGVVFRLFGGERDLAASYGPPAR